MKGIAIVLGMYCLGEVLSWATHGMVPAGVGGMVLLFAALRTGIVKGHDVKGVCRFLLDNMMLFFVPVSVGLMSVEGFGRGDIIPLTLILVVPVVVVLAVSGLIMEKMHRKKGGGQ